MTGCNQEILTFIFLLLLSCPGDEIIAINGRKVEGLVHAEVVSLFREVRRGAITIQLGRKLPKDREGMYITADQLTQLVAVPNGQPQ